MRMKLSQRSLMGHGDWLVKLVRVASPGQLLHTVVLAERPAHTPSVYLYRVCTVLYVRIVQKVLE